MLEPTHKTLLAVLNLSSPENTVWDAGDTVLDGVLERGRMTLRPTDYATFLDDLKTRIQASRTRAALAVNHELIVLYWKIGRGILEQQNRLGWGAKVAGDLRQEFRDSLCPRRLETLFGPILPIC
jgi:DUF1016 N-terminal domain